MTYKGWMELTAYQWLNYNAYWTSALKQQLKDGKLTQQQYNAIWKRRVDILGNLRDSTGAKASNDPTATPSLTPEQIAALSEPIGSKLKSTVTGTASAVGTAVSNGVEALGSFLSVGKYVVIGFGALLIILIFGRR